MGVAHVEREGVSVRHAARFLLVGTMNPEEGELRPQLLDRFGLTVEVRASRDPAERAEVVRRRLAYEADPEGFAAALGAGGRGDRGPHRGAPGAAARGDAAGRRSCCAITARLRGVRGGRHARGPGDGAGRDRARGVGRRDAVTAEDVRQAAPARAAAPPPPRPVRRARPGRGAARRGPARRRRRPERQGPAPRTARRPRRPDGPAGRPTTGGDGPEATARPGAPRRAGAARTGARPHPSGRRRNSTPGDRGKAPPRPAAPRPRRRAAFGPALHRRRARRGAPGRRSRPAPRRPHRRLGPGGRGCTCPPPSSPPRRTSGARGRRGVRRVRRREDLREPVREGREGNLVLFAVDASGSMAARQRMRAVKGAVLSLLLDAYQRRDKVGLVTFRGTGPSSRCRRPPRWRPPPPPDRSCPPAAAPRSPPACCGPRGVLRAERLRDPAGARCSSSSPTAARPAGAATDAALPRRPPACGAREVGVTSVVVDCETGPVRLGLAAELARPARRRAAYAGRAAGRRARRGRTSARRTEGGLMPQGNRSASRRTA